MPLFMASRARNFMFLLPFPIFLPVFPVTRLYYRESYQNGSMYKLRLSRKKASFMDYFVKNRQPLKAGQEFSEFLRVKLLFGIG
jgi:hypothetical protein